MKLVVKVVVIVLFLLLASGMFIGASIWEGTAVVAPDGVLPNTGYYAAINSFPRNTAVIVTNLENGKTVHVTVVAALDNSSVLILLSREAADAIALSADYPGRVRVMEAVDPITMLPPLVDRLSNGDPDYDPMARINAAPQNPPAPIPEGEASALAEDVARDAGDEGVAVAEEDEAPPPVPEGEASTLAEDVARDAGDEGVAVAEEDEAPPPVPEGEASALAEDVAPAGHESPVVYSDDYNLALIPAEKRAPEGKGVDIPLDEQIAPIATHQEQEQIPDTVNFITSLEDALVASQPQNGAVARASFSAPMITIMEKGMYYVQLRSDSRPELVESELVKIEKQHNVVVQMTELSGRQLYRILIGPLSYSESNQLLRQYKEKGWSDAFVWVGK
ncbi:MAG: hypothetical protein LBL45_04395 [Treponema sp.]|jgi:hypothetical protein|nr:hypothetical protein [Treponema sp.]